MKKQTMDWLLLAVLLSVWGLNYPSVKFGLEYSAPLAFSFYRVFVAAVASIPLVALSLRAKKPSKSFRNVKAIVATILFAITSTVLFLGFWFIAETVVPAGITAVIIYTYPLFTVLFTWLFLSEKLTSLKVLGIITGFIGIFLILTSGNISRFSVNPYGFTFLFIAAISFAASFVVYRRWLLGFDRPTLNALILFLSAAILFGWTFAGNANSLFSIQFLNPLFVIPLLYTGVIGTTIAYLIWMILVERRGPVWLSSWLFFVPIVALLSSSILLHEHVDLAQLLGFLVTILGIAAVNRK
ncbi:MAG: DMT family transporter [Nitrososphaerales archaeon]